MEIASHSVIGIDSLCVQSAGVVFLKMVSKMTPYCVWKKVRAQTKERRWGLYFNLSTLPKEAACLAHLSGKLGTSGVPRVGSITKKG